MNEGRNRRKQESNNFTAKNPGQKGKIMETTNNVGKTECFIPKYHAKKNEIIGPFLFFLDKGAGTQSKPQ